MSDATNAVYFMVHKRGTACTNEHPTLESAKKEAERLARKHPGDSFSVLGVIGAVRIAPPADPPVEWTTANPLAGRQRPGLCAEVDPVERFLRDIGFPVVGTVR